MFKKLFLTSVALMIGCASSKPQAHGPPVPVVVDPTINMQPPASLAKPNALPSEKPVYKGDLWELRASNDWKKKVDPDAELVLFSKDETTVAILAKSEFVGDLDMLAAQVSVTIKENGGQLMTTRTSYINTRKSIEIEALMSGGVIWVWSFATGAEGYTFTCGGDVAEFDKNRQL